MLESNRDGVHLEAKCTIRRRRPTASVSVSALSDEYAIYPTLLLRWQNQAFEYLGVASQNVRTRRGVLQAEAAERARVAAPEGKLAKRDAVIAEMSKAYPRAPAVPERRLRVSRPHARPSLGVRGEFGGEGSVR